MQESSSEVEKLCSILGNKRNQRGYHMVSAEAREAVIRYACEGDGQFVDLGTLAQQLKVKHSTLQKWLCSRRGEAGSTAPKTTSPFVTLVARELSFDEKSSKNGGSMRLSHSLGFVIEGIELSQLATLLRALR